MNAIDVKDLPEPIAQALDAMVRALREQLQALDGKRQQEPVQLPTKPGKALGTLRREEIYEDVG